MPPRSSGKAGSSPPRAGGTRRRPRRLLGLTARLELWQSAGIAGLVFIGLLALWWLATASGWVGPLFLPSPLSVWRRLVELAANGQLWQDAEISLYRILAGFLIASALAIPVGVLVGCYRFWEAAIEPLVD